MPGTDTADLEKLAAELGARGFAATITISDGRPPYLTAWNPDASALTEMILVDQGFYWWSWVLRGSGRCRSPDLRVSAAQRLILEGYRERQVWCKGDTRRVTGALPWR